MPHAQSVDNPQRESVGDSSAFWIIFLVTFFLLFALACLARLVGSAAASDVYKRQLFALACLARLVGSDWRALMPGAEGSKSMLQGVKTAVYTLMSQII